jgi:hypothetical protein
MHGSWTGIAELASQFATTATGGQRPLLAARRRELGVTLEMLVGLREQVSVDVGASPYIATDRTQSLDA